MVALRRWLVLVAFLRLLSGAACMLQIASCKMLPTYFRPSIKSVLKYLCSVLHAVYLGYLDPSRLNSNLFDTAPNAGKWQSMPHGR